MRPDLAKNLSRRLTELEQGAARLRKGVVISSSPLEIELGAAGDTFTDVKSVGAVSDGDVVAVLVRDNGLLVLGAIGDGSGGGGGTGGSLLYGTAAPTGGVGSDGDAGFALEFFLQLLGSLFISRGEEQVGSATQESVCGCFGNVGSPAEDNDRLRGGHLVLFIDSL